MTTCQHSRVSWLKNLFFPPGGGVGGGSFENANPFPVKWRLSSVPDSIFAHSLLFHSSENQQSFVHVLFLLKFVSSHSLFPPPPLYSLLLFPSPPRSLFQFLFSLEKLKIKENESLVFMKKSFQNYSTKFKKKKKISKIRKGFSSL